jgi:hypothetical protein
LIDTESIFYINTKGKRIDRNSSYTDIIREINELGIDTAEITIDELLIELDVQLSIKHRQIVQDTTYLEQLREYSEFHNQIRVIYKHIMDDVYNLYSYNEDNMPTEIKRIFKSKYF